MRKIFAFIAMMLLAVCPKAMAEETATLLWSVEGSVKHNYDSETVDGKATLEAYSDGSYTLKNYYTEGGSDLTFTVSEGTITITSGSKNYLYNVSGPEAIDIIYYYDGQYSSFEGDQTKGSLYFYYYYYADGLTYGSGLYYYFEWPSSTTTISSLKASAPASDRITSITGIDYGKASRLPAGLYVKNGKKFIAR